MQIRDRRHTVGYEPKPVPREERREQEIAEKKRRLKALRALQHGVESFSDFVRRVRPDYWPIPDHLKPLYELIDRSRYEQVRAVVSMPPRHGKTETLMLAVAYRVLYDPACQNAYATYGSDLSEPFGRAVRTIVQRLGVQVGKASADTVKGATAKVLDWKVPQGGGLKSTSLGGGITGRGVTGLLIIDDPIKGQEAAGSLAERERVWKWLRSDILSRIEGGCSVIIVQTRWHEDDPIGRMLLGGPDWEPGLGEHYTHINLPAIGDEYGNPVDEREHPERARPLWPSINSRYPNNRAAAIEWYRICRARGEFEWWSLYQGVPRSRDRKVFAEDPALYQLPIKLQGKRAMLMLDPAATAKTSSNYSALGAFAMSGYGDATIKTYDRKGHEIEIENPNPSVMDVLEIFKDRKPVPDMVSLARSWQKRYRLPCGVECDGVSASLPDWIKRLEPKLQIVEILTGGRDKYTRALPASKAWNSGRIRTPAGIDVDGNEIVIPWDVSGYVRVMKAFTGMDDPEDDVVDITAHSWNRMYREFKPDQRRSVQIPG